MQATVRRRRGLFVSFSFFFVAFRLLAHGPNDQQPLAAGHHTRPSIKSWTTSSQLIDGASVRFGVELNQSIDQYVVMQTKPSQSTTTRLGPVGPQDDEAQA